MFLTAQRNLGVPIRHADRRAAGRTYENRWICYNAVQKTAIFLSKRCIKLECCVSLTELLKMMTVWQWLSRAPTHQTPVPDLQGRAWSRCRWSPHLRTYKKKPLPLWTTTQSLWRLILSPFLTQRFDDTEIHECDRVKILVINKQMHR